MDSSAPPSWEPRLLHGRSMAFRISVAIGLTLLLAGGAQLVLLLEFPAVANAHRWLLFIPLFLATLAWGFFIPYVVQYRLKTIESAMDRIARGELTTRLPPAPAKEFRRIELGFANMAEALRLARADLSHADAQRRRLFADLAHDLATPTTTILGLVDALADPDLSASEEQRNRFIAALSGEAARLSRLTTDVRHLAMLDNPEMRLEPVRVNLGDIARSVVERLSLAGGSSRVECCAAVAEMDADPLRMEQVLVNLIKNAERHTPEGGSIRVTVESRADELRLVVEDSGPGVPEQELSKLGERMYRPDSARSAKTGGHGIGLAIVRAIVHRHGGRIRFRRSALGGLAAEMAFPHSTRESLAGSWDDSSGGSS